MPTIKNKLNSPLSIDLGGGKSIHLLPLEKRDISKNDVKANQVQAALRAGYIQVLPDQAPARKKGSDN